MQKVSAMKKGKKKLKVSDSSYKYVGYGPTQTLTGRLSFFIFILAIDFSWIQE